MTRPLWSRAAVGLAIGLAIFVAFASAAIWALALLATLPWQILALCVACCALFAWAHWLDSRTKRLAQERSAAALRIVDGEEPCLNPSTTVEPPHAKGAWTGGADVGAGNVTRGASAAGPGLRVVRGGR